MKRKAENKNKEVFNFKFTCTSDNFPTLYQACCWGVKNFNIDYKAEDIVQDIIDDLDTFEFNFQPFVFQVYNTRSRLKEEKFFIKVYDKSKIEPNVLSIIKSLNVVNKYVKIIKNSYYQLIVTDDIFNYFKTLDVRHLLHVYFKEECPCFGNHVIGFTDYIDSPKLAFRYFTINAEACPNVIPLMQDILLKHSDIQDWFVRRRSKSTKVLIFEILLKRLVGIYKADLIICEVSKCFELCDNKKEKLCKNHKDIYKCLKKIID